MFDVHTVPAQWGLLPRIFGVSSYGLFGLLGIILGGAYYFLGMKNQRTGNEGAALIILGALLGGGIGAKLPLLLLNFKFIVENPAAFATGRTVLGGLLGGAIGVLAVKKLCHIHGRYGNIIAPAAALGLGIGRIGCLLTGCCYGREIPLMLSQSLGINLGLNLGDGLLRYPTQVFEIIFHFAAFFILHRLSRRPQAPGILFKGYVLCYLIFRYFTEFIRESEILWASQTLYQWLCIGGIVLLGIKLIKAKNELKEAVPHG